MPTTAPLSIEESQELFDAAINRIEPWVREATSSCTAPSQLTEAEIDFLCSVGTSSHRPLPTPNPLSAVIGPCLGCGRDLQWAVPTAGLWASPVPCPECGRWHYTQGRNDCAPNLRLRRSMAFDRVRGLLRTMFRRRRNESLLGQ